MIAGSLCRAVFLLAIARHCAASAGSGGAERRAFVSAGHFGGCAMGRARLAGWDGGVGAGVREAVM